MEVWRNSQKNLNSDAQIMNVKIDIVPLWHKDVIFKLQEKNYEWFGMTTMESLQWHYLCLLQHLWSCCTHTDGMGLGKFTQPWWGWWLPKGHVVGGPLLSFSRVKTVCSGLILWSWLLSPIYDHSIITSGECREAHRKARSEPAVNSSVQHSKEKAKHLES